MINDKAQQERIFPPHKIQHSIRASDETGLRVASRSSASGFVR